MRAITRLMFALPALAIAIIAFGSASPAVYAQPTLPTVEIVPLDSFVLGPYESIEFHSSDGNVTGYECRLDDDAFADCQSPFFLENASDGLHTFRVRALSEGGAGPVDSVRFYVDATGPTIFLRRVNDVTGPNVTITFGGFDRSGVHFECSLDNNGLNTCTSPVELTNLSDGQHTFTVRGTDGVGNQSDDRSVTWTVDATPPDTSIVISPPNETTSHTARFVFSAKGELNRTFECSLDDAPFTRCDSPKTYTNLNSGGHTFAVRAVDRAGNVDPSPAEVAWQIVSAGPD